MNQPTIRAQDVLDPAWVPTYLQYREALWKQLVRLNISLYHLQKIESFPFDVFLVKDETIFWQTAKTALIETALSIEWKIFIDTSNQSLGLSKFKNETLRHVVDANLRHNLKVSIKQIGFDALQTQYEDAILGIRHSYIGHLDELLHLDPNQHPVNLRISTHDMKLVLDGAKAVFDVLCFDEGHSLWNWGYTDYNRDHNKTDIDELLASVARNSHIVDMPEEQPDIWTFHLQESTDFELEWINCYREHFGLPRISREVNG